jgi:hypothetical protein
MAWITKHWKHLLHLQLNYYKTIFSFKELIILCEFKMEINKMLLCQFYHLKINLVCFISVWYSLKYNKNVGPYAKFV